MQFRRRPKALPEGAPQLLLHIEQAHAIGICFLFLENLDPGCALFVRRVTRGEVAVSEIMQATHEFVARISDQADRRRNAGLFIPRANGGEVGELVPPSIKNDLDGDPLCPRKASSSWRDAGSMLKPSGITPLSNVLATTVVPVFAGPRTMYQPRCMLFSGLLSQAKASQHQHEAAQLE